VREKAIHVAFQNVPFTAIDEEHIIDLYRTYCGIVRDGSLNSIAPRKRLLVEGWFFLLLSVYVEKRYAPPTEACSLLTILGHVFHRVSCFFFFLPHRQDVPNHHQCHSIYLHHLRGQYFVCLERLETTIWARNCLGYVDCRTLP